VMLLSMGQEGSNRQANARTAAGVPNFVHPFLHLRRFHNGKK
jgi:hypothetical protein